tara:strand:- start:925 stop:1476 length:552 start_codon:yes stop_codon:yes gene_type:complete
MWTYLGKVIRVGRGWTDAEGVKHPATWNRWTDTEKTAHGLVWDQSLQPVPFDNRFYWDATTPKNIADVNAVDEDGNAILDEDGVQVVTKGLKSNAIAQTKVTAGSLLAPTDWHVVKASEVSGYTVPSAITTYRAAVRTASNTIETAITNAADHAAFMALYDVPVDADGNPTGNAPINDWPDEV